MLSVWFTDCKSAHSALMRPIGKTIDKRLGIEIAALRQSLWRYKGRTALEARLQDGAPIPSEATDVARWVDTAVMPCDPLTKAMSDEFLQGILDSGIWNFAQPEASKEVKRKKQNQRHRKKHGDDTEYEDD